MEVIREKRRFMSEKGMERDFWMVPNPEFLDSNPEIDNRVRKPCCALVSTDERWITFMKLRYDKVLATFLGTLCGLGWVISHAHIWQHIAPPLFQHAFQPCCLQQAVTMEM